MKTAVCTFGFGRPDHSSEYCKVYFQTSSLKALKGLQWMKNMFFHIHIQHQTRRFNRASRNTFDSQKDIFEPETMGCQ